MVHSLLMQDRLLIILQHEARSRLPTSTPMSQDGYELDVTLTGHRGTITALQFSPDCKFLASGDNHGVLLVFSTASWRPLKRLIDASPITTVVWHDTQRYLLLCGCESGDLHFLNFTKSSVRPSLFAIFTWVSISSRKSLLIRRHTLEDQSARCRFHQLPPPWRLATEKEFLSRE